MSNATYYIQDCPTCGRCLRVRVEHLGRELTCQHCRGKIVARDPEDVAAPAKKTRLELLDRADELLSQVRLAQ